MVLFYQPDEMHLRQSGSQHHDQHREFHAPKAARRLVSVGGTCGYKNGSNVGYPNEAKAMGPSIKAGRADPMRDPRCRNVKPRACKLTEMRTCLLFVPCMNGQGKGIPLFPWPSVL